MEPVLMEYFITCVCALITFWALVEKMRDDHGNLRSAIVHFCKRIVGLHKACSAALEWLVTAAVYVLYLVLEVVSPSPPPKKQKIETGSRSNGEQRPDRQARRDHDAHHFDREDPHF
jgi:hypothetical protein